MAHLGEQTYGLRNLEELVVTFDGGLSERLKADIEGAAGRSITYVELPPDTDYYEAKNKGFNLDLASWSHRREAGFPSRPAGSAARPADSVGST